MAITTAELITKLRAGEKVTSAAYDPAKQAAGYAKRLEGAGVDVASATDDRGWFGKLLNLNQDQGFFGDAFEIMDRPLNALSAALIGEDAWASFTGNTDKEYTYTDVFKNIGLDDTTSAIIGTVANIIADPIDIVAAIGGVIAAPFTAGGSLAFTAGVVTKALSAIDATVDTVQLGARVTDALKAGNKLLKNSDEMKDLLKSLGYADDVIAKADDFMDVLGKARNAGGWTKKVEWLDRIEKSKKGLFKLPSAKEWDSVNWLGKTFKTVGVPLSPLSIMDAYKDVGMAIAFRKVGDTFGMASHALKTAAMVPLNAMQKIGWVDLNDWKKFLSPVGDKVELAKRLLGFTNEKIAEGMKLMSDTARKLTGEHVFAMEQLMGGLSNDGLDFTKDVGKVFDSLATSENAAYRAIHAKGRPYFDSLFASALEQFNPLAAGDRGAALRSNLNKSIEAQNKLIGGRYDERGMFVFNEAANTNVIINNKKVIATSASTSSYNHLTDDAGKFQERVKSLKSNNAEKAVIINYEKDNFVSKIDSKTGKATERSASSLALDTAADEIRNHYATIYPDGNVTVVVNKISDNSIAGDIEIYVHNRLDNGDVESIMASKFEIKSTDKFLLGEEVISRYGVYNKRGDRLIDPRTNKPITGDQLQKLVDDIKKDPLVEDLMEARIYFDKDISEKALDEYLGSKPDVLYVIEEEGVKHTYYMSKDDIKTLIKDKDFVKYNERLRTKYSVKKSAVIEPGEQPKAKMQPITMEDGKEVVGEATGTIRTTDVKGAKLTIPKGAGARFQIQRGMQITDMEQMKKFLVAQIGKFEIRRQTTTIYDMMMRSVAGTFEFTLDQKTFNAMREALEASPELRTYVTAMDKGDMLKSVKLANGEDAYTITEDGKDIMKQLIIDLEKGKDSTKNLMKTLTARPNFFSQSMVDDMEALTGGEDFLALQKSYTKFMSSATKKIDAMGAIATKYSSEFGANYVRHTLDTDVKKVLDGYMSTADQRSLFSSLHANVNKLAERRYDMTIFEANMLIDSKLRETLSPKAYAEITSKLGTEQINIFTNDITKSALDFYKTIGNEKEQIELLNVMIKTDLLTKASDTNKFPLIRPLEPGKPSLGYVPVKKEALVENITKLSKHFKDEATAKDLISSMEKFVSEIGGDANTMLIDTNIYSMIGKLGNPDEALGGLAGMIDKVNTLFKSTKLLTPGFHMRNIVGNYMNISLSSMTAGEVAELTQGLKDYFVLGTRGQDLISKVERLAGGVNDLTELERQQYKLYSEFVKNGFLQNSVGINELEEIMLKVKGGGVGLEKYVNKIMGASAAGNEYIDRMYRLALFDMATKNPAIYQRAGLNSAAEYVRFVLFDPKDLTQFEKNVMRRIIPFYTFTKKNLMYQLKNTMLNPTKYRDFNRMLDGAYDLVGSTQAEAPDYQEEAMYIPIPFTDKDGKFTTFKANLPQADLNEWAADPLRRLMSSLAPYLRVPFELVTNQQVYTGLPISEFEGQKGYKLPFLNRWGEYALSQTGLDAPIGVATNIASGNIGGAFAMGSADLEAAETSRAYDELSQLRDIMSYYKQEGVRIPTIAELENQGQMTKMDQMLAAING